MFNQIKIPLINGIIYGEFDAYLMLELILHADIVTLLVS